MEVISHFSHEHPLIIFKQVPTGLIDGQKIECNCCRKPLLKEEEDDKSDDDDVYGCELCQTLFLHKSCAQLPTTIAHKSHEQHLLFLLAEKPSRYSIPGHCNVCRGFLKGFFFYHCDLCEFDLDIKCAFKDKDSELVDVKKDHHLSHLGHEHTLTLLPRPASFHCNACDVQAKDFSYQCSPCNYWIHRRCALLPSTTRRADHPHILSLVFRLPSEYNSFNYNCDICKETLHEYNHIWFYYCNLCRYFVHIKCMETYKPQRFDLKIEENLLRLPATDIAGELIQRFLLKVDSLPELEAEIQIFSHKHPLKLSYQHINEDDIDNNDDEEILCDACIQPITSLPYYCCAECKYFLHLPCSKLPAKLGCYDGTTDHNLILGETRIYDTFCCDRCKDISNRYYFSCVDEGCKFILDVKCAAFPYSIVHETHIDPLFDTWYHKGRLCKGCGRFYTRNSGALFSCLSCDFTLDLQCLMVPRTVSHRYDSNHRLTLKYPPHDYHPRPFDCYECDREIHPWYWLYHCEDCDLSLHTYCIPRIDIFPGVKCGQRIQISYHPHPLQHVRCAAVHGSTCHRCGRNMAKITAFQCETCNFRLCQECVLAIDETQD